MTPWNSSKRALVAEATAMLGLTRMLESLPKRPALVVLNYHRIGDAERTRYDPYVFSTTAQGLDEQIRFIQERYPIVSLSHATDIVTGRRRPRGVAVLLTFDDGYVDNYAAAFPVLRARGAPATFFLITSHVGTAHVPHWDRIAWAVRHAPPGAVRLRAPHDLMLDLREPDRLVAVRQALAASKSHGVTDPGDFVEALEEACAATPRLPTDRVLMSWTEAAEMVRGGMDIASHTHSHKILSHLARQDQVDELATSRRVLRERLGLNVTACAYPDGVAETWNGDTFSAMQEAGYEIGFTFHGGVNFLPHASRFDVKRTVIAPTVTLSQLRLRLGLAGIGRDEGF